MSYGNRTCLTGWFVANASLLSLPLHALCEAKMWLARRIPNLPNPNASLAGCLVLEKGSRVSFAPLSTVAMGVIDERLGPALVRGVGPCLPPSSLRDVALLPDHALRRHPFRWALPVPSPCGTVLCFICMKCTVM